MLRTHTQFWAYVALALVCFFWGTTYLGIRMALESFPPATLVALRYVVSGSILLAASKTVGARLPRGRELWLTALFGVIIIGVGNGCLAFAETWIPSGLAALMITVSPFWMVGVDALVPGGEKLHGPTILGMLVGFAGTVLLVGPSAVANGFGGPVLKGFLLLQLGSFGWAFGSILQRRHPTRAHPVVSGAVQQLATGLIYAAFAWRLDAHAIHWTTRGVSALLYLVTFGSLVGYSAYLYALDKLPVSVVSLYNYVNPVVAVGLGWLFYRERVGWRELGAMAIIFGGVALVKRFGRVKEPPQIPAVPPPVSPGEERRHTTV
jgi:drug/metabolite transporter (DMT)-like permease